MLLRMNKRERDIRAARQHLSDARLVAFLRAANESEYGVLAIRLICEALDQGKTLDDIFYNGTDFGYMLSVDHMSESSFQIHFGYHAAPLAGDGGLWDVSFTGDEVASINIGSTWIS